MTGRFERVQPRVAAAGHTFGDLQFGEAFSARWRWSQQDGEGNWYYLTELAAVCRDANSGGLYVERRYDYDVDGDPRGPGNLEVWADHSRYDRLTEIEPADAVVQRWVQDRPDSPDPSVWPSRAYFPLPR